MAYDGVVPHFGSYPVGHCVVSMGSHGGEQKGGSMDFALVAGPFNLLLGTTKGWIQTTIAAQA